MPHLAYFAASLLGPADRRHYLPVLHSLRSLAGALRPEIFEELQDLQPWEALMEFAGAHGSHSEQVFNTYLHTYLHGLLVVEDRISMAHSLESRTPLLDNAMLELSLTVPSEIKLDRGRLKAIVKSGAETLLPRVLASQPKRGFPTPLRHWLRGPLVSLLEDRLGGPGSHLRALFRPEWLQSTVSGYLRSPLRSVRPLDEIRSHRIWQLLCLESWLRQCEEVWGIRVVDRPGVP
jgi:asparagine synthase (glutamine-hydrolysing)